MYQNADFTRLVTLDSDVALDHTLYNEVCENCTIDVIRPIAPSRTPVLSALITSKSGSLNARNWTISLANNSEFSEKNAQIDQLTLFQTSGGACTPSVTNPSLFPLGLGNIAARNQANGSISLDFTGCPNNARFKAVIDYSSNDSAVCGSNALNNQFR